MILSDYENRLKQCNPKLSIRKYGKGIAGVFLGNRYILRLDQGELWPYNSFKSVYGQSKDYATPLNPSGKYKYRHMVSRGRVEAARILYTQRLISFNHITYLTHI